jgi:hypothetical protein
MKAILERRTEKKIDVDTTDISVSCLLSTLSSPWRSIFVLLPSRVTLRFTGPRVETTLVLLMSLLLLAQMSIILIPMYPSLFPFPLCFFNMRVF